MRKQKRLDTYSLDVVYERKWGMSSKACGLAHRPRITAMKAKEVKGLALRPRIAAMKAKEVKAPALSPKIAALKAKEVKEQIKSGRKFKVDMEFDSKVNEISSEAEAITDDDDSKRIDENSAGTSNEISSSESEAITDDDDSKRIDENSAGTSNESVISTSSEYEDEEEDFVEMVSPVKYTRDEILYLNALRMYYQGAPSRTLVKLKPYEYHDYFEALVKEVEEEKKAPKNNPFFSPRVSKNDPFNVLKAT